MRRSIAILSVSVIYSVDPPNPNDFARDRPTLASSYLYSSPPSAAVNGDKSVCYQSDEELQPWWMVDLGKGVSMGTVTLLPVSPLPKAGPFSVLVSNIRGDWRTGEPCFPQASGRFSCVSVAGAVPKRYLYVVSARPALEGVLTTLTLCEIRIFRVGPALPLPYLTASGGVLSFSLQGDSLRPGLDAVVLIPASTTCGQAQLAGISIPGYRKYLAISDPSTTTISFPQIALARRGVYKVCWCSGAIFDCNQASDFAHLAALVLNQPNLEDLTLSLPADLTAVALSADFVYYSDGDGLHRLSLTTPNAVPALISARFANSPGLAVNAAGSEIYASLGHAVFRVSLAGSAALLVGVEAESGFAGDSARDLTSVRLNEPACLALDERRNFLFICDSGNLRIRALSFDEASVATVLGGGLFTTSGVIGQDFNLADVLVSSSRIKVQYGENGVDTIVIGLYVSGSNGVLVRLEFFHPDLPVGVVHVYPAGAPSSSFTVQDSVMYRVGAAMTQELVREYGPLGCYRERHGAELLQAVSQTEERIDTCAEKVVSLSKVFGVRDGGICVSGLDALLRYAEEGQSSTCVDGKGSRIDNSVYIFSDTGLWSEVTTLQGTYTYGGSYDTREILGVNEEGDMYIMKNDGNMFRLPYVAGSDVITLEEQEEKPPVTDCVLCGSLEISTVRYSQDCTRLTIAFNDTVTNEISDLTHEEVHVDAKYFGLNSKHTIYENILSIELGLYPEVGAGEVELRIPSRRVMSGEISDINKCQGEKFPITISTPPVFGRCGKWRAVLEDGVRISGRAPKSINWLCVDSWPNENLCASVIQPQLSAKAWCGPVFAVNPKHAQMCEMVAELVVDMISDPNDFRITFQVELIDWRGEKYTTQFFTKFVNNKNTPLGRPVGAISQSLRLQEAGAVRFEVASRSLHEECETEMSLAQMIDEHVNIEWRVARKPVSVGGEIVTADWSEMEPLQSAGITENVGIFDLQKIPQTLRSRGEVLVVVALVSYSSGQATGVPVPFEISVVDGSPDIPLHFTPRVGSTCPVVVDASEVVTGRPDLAGASFVWSCVTKISGVTLSVCSTASGPVLVLAPGSFPAGVTVVTVARGNFQRALEITRGSSLPLETVLIPDLRSFDSDATVKLLTRGNAAIGAQCVWTREDELTAKYVVAGTSGLERATTPVRASEDVVIAGVGFRLRNFRTSRSSSFTVNEEEIILRGTQVDVYWGTASTFVMGLRETTAISAGEIVVYPEVAEAAETYVLVQQAWSGLYTSTGYADVHLYGAAEHGEADLLLDFRSARTQYVPLLGGERAIHGSVVSGQGPPKTTLVAARATVRPAPVPARDPAVVYDLLVELDELLRRTLVKIQTVASLNEPRLQCLVYEEYAKARLPDIASLQKTQDARDVSNKAIMTVRELLIHLNEAFARLESPQMLTVGVEVLATVHSAISSSGYDDLDVLEKAVTLLNTYFATLARLDVSIDSETAAVEKMVDLISAWILPRLVVESDFVGAAHSTAGVISRKLVQLIDQLARSSLNFLYASGGRYISIHSFTDSGSISLPAVKIDHLSINSVVVTPLNNCHTLKRAVFTWTQDLYSYSRYNASDALFGAFTYALSSSCNMKSQDTLISYSIAIPQAVQELARRPAYMALGAAFACVAWTGTVWSPIGCSGRVDSTDISCTCPHRGGHEILAARLLPYPFDLEPKTEIDYSLVHNALTYFEVILLGVVVVGVAFRARDGKWLRRKTPGEYLVEAALLDHRTSRLTSRTRGFFRVMYDCVVNRDPRFFSAHVLELQMMRTSAREAAYKKFDAETAGRMQPELLSLLWEAPLQAVASMEAVYAETVARKKEKLVGVTKQAQLMAAGDDQVEMMALVQLGPMKTASDEYNEVGDTARSRLLEVQRRDARFQAAQTFKGIRAFATERQGEKPGAHTGQNWEESMMLVKAKFNGNPNFSGAFANAQILEKDLNSRYPVVKSLLWTTWSISDFLSHFFFTLHPLTSSNPVLLLIELATVFLTLGLCSFLCFFPSSPYPSPLLPDERPFSDVLSDIGRDFGGLEIFVGLLAITFARLIANLLIDRFFTPRLGRDEDFEAALRRWQRQERRGVLFVSIWVCAGFFLGFLVAAVNAQTGAGRAVAAALVGLGAHWVVRPCAEIFGLTYIFWRAKWSAEWDGVLAWTLHLTDTAETRRQRLVDEEFLTDVHRLHPRVRASFRRFTRDPPGVHLVRDSGAEVLSEGEAERDSE